MSTTPKDPDKRNLKYLQLVELQRYGPKVDIASKFGRASDQEVFEELKGYGFPVCEVCGANPVVGRHCPKDKPKARQVEGNPEDLPSIKNAATTLRDSIRTLDVYLEQALSLKESLQGRYFVCEGETEEDNIREFRGMQWHPHFHVVVLIAMSILEHGENWWHVERLLKELHPTPATANRQQLFRFIFGKKVDERGRPILDKEGRPQDEGDGLLDRANQIAALIRGKSKIGTGRKGPAIPPYEHLVILHIRSLMDRGLSQKEIAQREREEFKRWKEEHLRSLHKELESEKATLGNDDLDGFLDELKNEIRRAEIEEYDEGQFKRLYELARDFR